ncbi:MAG: hypothetical protein IJR14_09320 [Synergistaceae bacterium]|nr:hypothetical protein [Synergistaceae bacterium]
MPTIKIKMERVLLAAALCLALPLAALATVQDFGKFTVDVLEGWTATPDGTTVAIVADDSSGAVTVTIEPLEGYDIKDLAEAMAQQLKGTAPQLDDDVYTFTFTNVNGVESVVIMSDNGTDYLTLSITGEGETLENIVQSIAFK